MEKKIAAKKLPPPCQTRESPPLNRWNRWKAQELCEGRTACRCGEINLPARRTSRYGRAFFRQCAQRSANIDPSIYHPMRWTAARFHPDRSTRSTDRSLPVGQSEGEERRDERATMRRRHNLQDRWVPRACSRTPPPPEEKEEEEEGWARRRGRAKNRSLIGIKT